TDSPLGTAAPPRCPRGTRPDDRGPQSFCFSQVRTEKRRDHSDRPPAGQEQVGGVFSSFAWKKRQLSSFSLSQSASFPVGASEGRQRAAGGDDLEVQPEM